MNKRKLKSYCTLFVIALVLSVFKINLNFRNSFITGSESESELEFGDVPASFYSVSDTTFHEGGYGLHQVSSYKTYQIYVRPKPVRDGRDLISKVGEQVYRLKMRQVFIDVPEGQLTDVYDICMIISYSVIVILILWILILALKTARSILRGNVFVTRVSKYLEKTGILLSSLYLIQFSVSYIFTQYLIRNIELAEYEVVFTNDTNQMYILTGLALMIISQIILMGKDIKDEHDLTI